MLGRVHHCLMGQLQVGLISCMRISPGEQTCPKCVGVVDSAVFTRNVTDANPVSFREGLEVAENVFTCTHGDLQIPISLEVIEGIQESVPDQRGPHHGRKVLGYITAS